MRNPFSRWQVWKATAHLTDTSRAAAWEFVTQPDFWLTFGADVASVAGPSGAAGSVDKVWRLTRQDGTVLTLTVARHRDGLRQDLMQDMGMRVEGQRGAPLAGGFHRADVGYGVRLASKGADCLVTLELRLRPCLHLTHLEMGGWPEQAVREWADRVEDAHAHGIPERCLPEPPQELGDGPHVCYDATEELPYAPQRVWRVISEPEFVERTGLLRAFRDPARPEGVGAVEIHEYANGVTTTITVTRHEPFRLVEIATASEAGPLRTRYQLDPCPEGTRLRVTCWQPSERPASLHTDGRQVWASSFRHHRQVLDQGLDL